MKFPANIHKELKNYIYALYDPTENSELPFYVGRGVRDRVFSHLKESHNNEVKETINKIINTFFLGLLSSISFWLLVFFTRTFPIR